MLLTLMSHSSEKLVKYTVKTISKKYNIDYEELKQVTKKIIKTARNADETLLGMMEELLDMGSCASEEELVDFNIEVLKIYCRIKDIDSSGSDKSIRRRVWDHIEEEFEDESDDEDSDGDDSGDSVEESEDEIVPEPEPEIKVKKSKPKKEKVVIDEPAE